MLTLILSFAISAYLIAGLLNWLISAVEMLGDTSNNSYLDSLNRFSKKHVVAEVLTFLYLLTGWPLHLLLKSLFKN